MDYCVPKPLAIDMFCGLGGWTEGLLAEGYDVVGFDNERHAYGDARYPAQLVIQDVLTIHGRQFKDAALIVASPPCQEYSYMAMPWTLAKDKAAALRDGRDDPKRLTALFDACFRIQREACEAAGRHIPLVVENVCGAQKWVGRARWHYGSFYLWGDVPALMPITRRAKVSVFRFDGSGKSFQSDAVKVSGVNWSDCSKHYDDTAKMQLAGSGIKQGGDWFNSTQPSISRLTGSKSTARRAASAHIAKIPYELSGHIAAAWKPA